MAVFVINQTMNQIEKSELIRYVVPIKDVRIDVKAGKRVRRIEAVTGQHVRHEFRNGWLRIHLPKLNEYEVLMVDL